MKKGILLIAIGHSNYMKMAINLAASIKATDYNCPICIVHDDETIKVLKENQKFLFDKYVSCPSKAYMTNGQTEYIKAKTWMYDLSPFNETLFLDVDMIWLLRHSPLMAIQKLSGHNWTMANTGIANESYWCDIEEVKKVYKTKNPLWNYHSEFVYFKKCKETRKYFTEVKRRYLNPKLSELRIFGGARLADELAFELASIVTGQYPHKENFNPVMWYVRDDKEKHLRTYELKDKYLAYSVGGSYNPPFAKNNYNILAASAFARLGLHHPYKLKDKRSFLTERAEI